MKDYNRPNFSKINQNRNKKNGSFTKTGVKNSTFFNKFANIFLNRGQKSTSKISQNSFKKPASKTYFNHQRAEKNPSSKTPFFKILTNLLIIVLIPFYVLWKIIDVVSTFLDKFIPRLSLVKGVGVLLFFSVVASFFNIFSQSKEKYANYEKNAYNIIPARRGNIYIHNTVGAKDISLTSSQIVGTITIDPKHLKERFEKKTLKKDEVVTKLASELNIPWIEINDLIEKETSKKNPLSSVVLKKDASPEQTKAIQNLRLSRAPERFEYWIKYDPVENRSYNLLGKAAGSITGYMQKDKVIRDDVINSNPYCVQMVKDNEERGTVDSYDKTNKNGEYKLGYYGIEGLYCSELGGLNGKTVLGTTSDTFDETNKVQNGADIYLTLDSNMQNKAQEVLDAAIQTNVSKINGKPPRDGLVMVMSLEKTEKTEPGEILAMASYPYADPNKYFNLKTQELAGFYNAANKPYESGSVIKPLTVAIAHDQWFKNAVNEKGERVGLDPNWNWVAYPPSGKIFEKGNGEIETIKNALNATYAEQEKLIKNCLQKSINTCLADIEQRISNSVQDIVNNGKNLKHDGLISYLRDKLLISKPKLVNFAAPGTSDTSAFDRENKIDISAANWSFGQGFRLTPIELARAYSAIARDDGTLVEPYIVQKIVFGNGKSYFASDPSAPLNIYRGEPQKVFDPRSVKLVQDYMVYTLDKYGSTVNPPAVNGYVNGYPIAAKTGTAQVTSHSEDYKDFCQGQSDMLSCSLNRGIYDQTYIGYGPVGEAYKGKPKFLVIIKLAEPRVGEKNYFGIAGLGQYFSQMFEYTLNYYDLPKDPSR